MEAENWGQLFWVSEQSRDSGRELEEIRSQEEGSKNGKCSGLCMLTENDPGERELGRREETMQKHNLGRQGRWDPVHSGGLALDKSRDPSFIGPGTCGHSCRKVARCGGGSLWRFFSGSFHFSVKQYALKWALTHSRWKGKLAV